jgi:hypothetical protein
MAEDNSNKVHLGYGAYAVYEGDGVWLCANHHNNKLVWIELPDGLDRLNEFVKQQNLKNEN